MSFLNFQKTIDKPTDQIQQAIIERPECDITKTQVMVELFRIPKDNRDEAWYTSFYENVQTASYACGSPQVINGPDGFPYFVLLTPEANKPFESFCIRNMKDDFLLEEGIGVVLNPTENGVDWVFSYGDILNLHLNKEFFSKTDNMELQNVETIEKGEEILIAQPSESYFPKQSRAILKSFLQSIGVEEPKLMMVCRKMEGEVIQELAFNLFAEDFESIDHLNFRLKQISWFLPRHYVLLSVPKEADWTAHFNDL